MISVDVIIQNLDAVDQGTQICANDTAIRRQCIIKVINKALHVFDLSRQCPDFVTAHTVWWYLCLVPSLEQ